VANHESTRIDTKRVYELVFINACRAVALRRLIHWSFEGPVQIRDIRGDPWSHKKSQLSA